MIVLFDDKVDRLREHCEASADFRGRAAPVIELLQIVELNACRFARSSKALDSADRLCA
jgi:hypothetical protein